MKIKDRVYGDISITEPVIIDLIKSYTLQRLKGVDQGGYSRVFYPGTEQTRFEHSVGVYYLLKRFGESLDGQIAGLLHDVSHSAFSHSIDYVFGKTEKDQSHQDNIFEEFVRNSDVLNILAAHGVPLELVIRLERYPLIHHDLPDLSADRLDYSFRTAVAFSLISQKEALSYIENLIIQKSHWVFKDYKYARNYARLFLKLNRELYSGQTSAIMFRTVGDCIGYAFKKRYISKSDLYSTDQELLRKVKIYLHDDVHLMKYWNRMNKRTAYEFTQKEHNAHVFCKSRIVDPFCMVTGKMVKLSDVDTSWKKTVTDELKPKEYFIRFYD